MIFNKVKPIVTLEIGFFPIKIEACALMILGVFMTPLVEYLTFIKKALRCLIS